MKRKRKGKRTGGKERGEERGEDNEEERMTKVRNSREEIKIKGKEK